VPSAPTAPSPADPAALAERVAAAVAAHPSVARLHAGVFGDVATHLPGGRLIGVRIGGTGEPVEIAVVLHPDRPIPEVVRALRREVSALCGGGAVDITVADLALPGEPLPGEPP
jgi:plasmid stabilization system protein ParE